MTKSTKKCKCSLVLNVDMGTESIDEYVKPIHEDDDILLDVECGPNKAMLYLSKLCTGSKGPCVSFQSSWLTPNEFQYVSGRETAKDWKRSIRHQGKSIKLLLSKGILVFKPLDVDSESSDIGPKPGKKRKGSSGKRQKKRPFSPNKSQTTSVDTQETESRSSASTIENTYVADEKDDVTSDSEKQTDESNQNTDDEKDGYSEMHCQQDQHDDTDIDENRHKETGEEKHCFEVENPTEKLDGDSILETPEKPDMLNEKTGKYHVEEKDNSCSSGSASPVLSEEASGTKQNMFSLEALSELDENKKEPEGLSDIVETAEEIKEMQPQETNHVCEDSTPEEKSTPKPQNGINTEPLNVESVPEEQQSDNFISVPKDETDKTIDPKFDRNDVALINDQSNDCRQERNNSPPRESRLQSIIEQLHVNKQKGVHKDSNDSELDKKLTKTPSDCISNENVEGSSYHEESLTDSQLIVKSCPEKSPYENPEKHEKLFQEESSCSRTEGRCSVKDNRHLKTWQKQNKADDIRDNERMHFLKKSDNEYIDIKNSIAESTEERNNDDTDMAYDSNAILGTSEISKPNRANDYIKLTKPSKSDIIVNGLINTISTEKKMEEQKRNGKHHASDMNSELAYPLISTDGKNLFPNSKYVLKNERHRPSNKMPYDIKRTEKETDFMHKSAIASPLGIKPPVLREQETGIRSTLPRSPKSGSIYPSSSLSLKSKETRCESHEVSVTSSSHGNIESLTKSDRMSPAYTDNIYNDYMRLLAATQRNLHLIPHPALDPYFMMRMSDGPFHPPYFLPQMHQQKDQHTTHVDTKDNSTSSVNFLSPPFPPVGMLPPGLPFGFPPIFPEVSKSRTSPSSGSMSKKPSVSPGNISAKRRVDEDHDVLDLSTKRPKLNDSRDKQYIHMRKHSHNERYTNMQHKISYENFKSPKITETVNNIPRNNSAEPVDFRKLHYSWIDKSDKGDKPVCKCSLNKSEDIRNWSVEKVCRFIAQLDGCSSYAEVFREHRLDGKRLPLLTTDQLVKSLGMKVGPAITLSEAVTRKIQEQSKHFQPCDYCKRKLNHRISI